MGVEVKGEQDHPPTPHLIDSPLFCLHTALFTQTQEDSANYLCVIDERAVDPSWLPSPPIRITIFSSFLPRLLCFLSSHPLYKPWMENSPPDQPPALHGGSDPSGVKATGVDVMQPKET